uniref:Integrator complex subunit 11 n=1 Tax=Sarcophilus harrisii TaxID=9305 RepID=G3VRK3_SARHA
MPEIKVTPLGAGQDVGRSCILVSIAGKNVMLDCGMHMGYNDDRRFPDFSYITQNGRLTDFLDCVIISHFHLDHCGALPYFSEMVGYDGPIYMTHPTKAICPILLEDYRKITVDKKGETNFFTSQMIKDCMKKVVAVHLHQTVQVDDELEIKAYYAGHVLGAAMFQIKVGSESAVYTGDYNMTPDRHLGAAWIDKCRPNLLITESTYATTIRDSKRCRERDFLKKVHETVERGGKVLIPVFALGRAQELCILLETFWERMNLKAPIYFSTGLTEKANHYYKLFITWTNQKIRKTFVQRNMFEFKHIKAFDRAFADNPGPMVVFATPGMLHAGQSLQIFRKWAGNEKNMVIMPGYCVQGTVGHKILSGQRKLEMEGRQILEVKMQVEYMSFSAHADAKGIMQLVRQAEPDNVLLVHGEAKKMEFLKQKIEQEFHVNCYMPANGETVTLLTHPNIPVGISLGLLKREMALGTVPGGAGGQELGCLNGGEGKHGFWWVRVSSFSPHRPPSRCQEAQADARHADHEGQCEWPLSWPGPLAGWQGTRGASGVGWGAPPGHLGRGWARPWEAPPSPDSSSPPPRISGWCPQSRPSRSWAWRSTSSASPAACTSTTRARSRRRSCACTAT